MDDFLSKKKLIQVAEQVQAGNRIEARFAKPFLAHQFPETSPVGKAMLRLAGWISLFFASVLVIFPEVGEWLIAVLPEVFLLPERLAKALDYVWGLLGKQVKKQHLMYHLPNIIIYSFGVVGLRQLWRKLNKNNWKDLIEDSQKKLRSQIENGTARFSFQPGFSLLFVGDGDQVAKSLVTDDPTIGPSLSSQRPGYSPLWGKYVSADGDAGMERVLDQINCEDAGEYVLFPVVDDQLFLPGQQEYDIPPHRVEIAVRRIRSFEQEQGWTPKRIVIVGDKVQTSRFVTTSQGGESFEQSDDVSLQTLGQDYENVIVADPTDITIQRIIDIADGRKILFRASQKGAEKYSSRFFERLAMLGYEQTQDATLTVGYDITDLETEHQIVSRTSDLYLPVILSRDVFDLLSKRYLKDRNYIFVPRLVKETLQELVK
ncbi:hypothetical protein [Shimia sp.]|uniref:hypothetical protein n=1 Tax=Shimia sp. TaxID=1954381 RepID=UPI00329A5B0C